MARSPFPGMDPYLEDPAYWEGFHDVLITECMYLIEEGLPQGYISNVKERAELIRADDPAAKVYIPDIGVARQVPARRRKRTEGSGGVAVASEIEPVTLASIDSIEVREAYIEILRVPGYELVTVIELMSPWNKHGGAIGIHQGKRASLVRDGVHFVELDLLRGGTRTKLSEPLPAGDYYAMVFRGDRSPDVDVFAWRLADKLPTIPIPLRAPDKDVPLNLGAAVHTAYERGRYDRKLRYGRELDLPLAPREAKWAEGLLNPARQHPLFAAGCNITRLQT
jgi:Protein of unknown function (DUF4058)